MKISLLFLLFLALFLGIPLLDHPGLVLYRMRLGREIMAFFTGGGLCLASLTLQNLTRNPLASEYTLGISAASSFFASLGLLIGFSPVFFGLVGGITTTFLLLFSARKYLQGQSLILLGIILNIFFASGISFLNYATSFRLSQSLSRWIFGGFSFYQWPEILAVGFSTLLLVFLVYFYSPQITLVSISEVYEEILGKSFRTVSLGVLLASGAFISLTTTYAGPIPFFALLLANLVRFLLNGNPHQSVLLSFLGGGGALFLLDSLARLASPLEEIPLGVLTGIGGLPFLTILFLRERA